jgi:hypothetical protein
MSISCPATFAYSLINPSAARLLRVVFWVVTPCSLETARSVLPASGGFLIVIFFDIEDGSEDLLRYIGLALDYGVLQPGRSYSS